MVRSRLHVRFRLHGHVYLRQRIQHDRGTCLPTPTDTTWQWDMFTYANGHKMTQGHVYLRQRIQHDMTGGHVCLRQRTQHDNGTYLLRQRLQHDNGTCLLRHWITAWQWDMFTTPTDTTWQWDMFTYANGYNMTVGHVYLRQRIQHDSRTCLRTPTDTTW